MHVKLPSDGESFQANVTLKGFFTSMSSNVLLEMRGVIEPFFTVFAFKRFLASVLSHVYL